MMKMGVLEDYGVLCCQILELKENKDILATRFKEFSLELLKGFDSYSILGKRGVGPYLGSMQCIEKFV